MECGTARISTVRLRTKVTKGAGAKAAGLAMAFKLIESAQRRWCVVNAPHLVALRLDDILPGEVWVHCRTGYRSTVAASLIASHGRDAIGIDDEIGNATTAGLPVVPSQVKVARR